MTREEKTAIIAIGGGMRSAYGAGFLYALGAKLGITKADIVIASSGNTGNALYYITGQYEAMEPIWCDILPTPRFISWTRIRPIMDVDYLVDDVFRKQFPLRVDLLEQSATEYFVPLLDMETGDIRYVRREDGVDPFELLRASKSIPFFYGKSTALLGRSYMDGGVAVTAYDMVAYALEVGATKILVIDNRTPISFRNHFILVLYDYLFASGATKKAIRQWNANREKELEIGDAKCVVIHPSVRTLPIARNPRKIRALFQMGLDDALYHEAELRSLFSV